MNESGQQKKRSSPAIYIEDALILVAIGLLFVLTIFFRDERWGQLALAGVFVAMLVVFIRRFRRTHRAFKGRE